MKNAFRLLGMLALIAFAGTVFATDYFFPVPLDGEPHNINLKNASQGIVFDSAAIPTNPVYIYLFPLGLPDSDKVPGSFLRISLSKKFLEQSKGNVSEFSEIHDPAYDIYTPSKDNLKTTFEVEFFSKGQWRSLGEASSFNLGMRTPVLETDFLRRARQGHHDPSAALGAMAGSAKGL